MFQDFKGKQANTPYDIKPVLPSQTTIRPIHNPMPENIDTAAIQSVLNRVLVLIG